MKMQCYGIVHHLLSFDLREADAILSLSWLEGLGEVQTNLKKITLMMVIVTKIITIKESSMSKSQASLFKIYLIVFHLFFYIWSSSLS